MRLLSLCLVMVLCACSSPQPRCDTTCTGCCDTQGQCVAGDSLTACGAFGDSCQRCRANESCGLGQCLAATGTGGGGGGGNDGGSDAGSGDGGSGDAGTPPQVFLTVTESNIIDTAISGQVAVSGCTVAQLQLLQADVFLQDLLPTARTFTLPPALFSALWPLGIGTSLTLKAKVVCSDGRTGTSLPLAFDFFPVASRFNATGTPLVPDHFVAEGGLGGTPNTFLGCAATNTGTAIVRVDTTGQVVAFNDTLPFSCSLETLISERSLVTGTRWILEPGAGAFAINNALSIVKVFQNVRTRRLGVGRSGAAVIWVDEVARSRVEKIDPVPSTTNDWSVQLVGLMNSTPVIDQMSGAVWVSDWRYDVGTKRGTTVALKLNLSNGALINGTPASVAEQQYPQTMTAPPLMPEGVFSADGAFFSLPVVAPDALSTTILSCSTAGGLCQGAARRWTSPVLPGALPLLLSFSQGNHFAAVGSAGVTFLNGQLGTVTSLGARPLQPSGGRVVLGVQPGMGTEFYVLAGPDLGPGQTGYPSEIIATDAPASGEVWRLHYNDGAAPGSSLHLGIDDAQRAWIRLGFDLVKPLPNSEYRAARGPTMP